MQIALWVCFWLILFVYRFQIWTALLIIFWLIIAFWAIYLSLKAFFKVSKISLNLFNRYSNRLFYWIKKNSKELKKYIWVIIIVVATLLLILPKNLYSTDLLNVALYSRMMIVFLVFLSPILIFWTTELMFVRSNKNILLSLLLLILLTLSFWFITNDEYYTILSTLWKWILIFDLLALPLIIRDITK